MIAPEPIEFSGYVPGALGRVVEMMTAYYARTHGFGVYFEAKTADEMAEFLRRFDASRDLFVVALSCGRVIGSIAVIGEPAGGGARLRWFFLEPEACGRGLGRKMLADALRFCRERFASVHLWTISGLDAAAHLYREAGFVLTNETRGANWGIQVVEQRFELRFDRTVAGERFPGDA